MKQLYHSIRSLRLLLAIIPLFLTTTPGLFAEEASSSSMDYPQIVYSIESLGLDGAGGMDELGQASLLSDLHKYFGYGAVALGAAAGIFNPALAEDDIHKVLGAGAAAMSAATLGLGFAAHYDEIGTEPAWNSNLIHTILGISGGTLMIAAPFLADTDIHPFVGGAGVVLMGTGVVWKLAF